MQGQVSSKVVSHALYTKCTQTFKCYNKNENMKIKKIKLGKDTFYTRSKCYVNQD